MQAEKRIFPIATLDFSRIRAVDADITYRATTIVNAPVNSARRRRSGETRGRRVEEPTHFNCNCRRATLKALFN